MTDFIASMPLEVWAALAAIVVAAVIGLIWGLLIRRRNIHLGSTGIPTLTPFKAWLETETLKLRNRYLGLLLKRKSRPIPRAAFFKKLGRGLALWLKPLFRTSPGSDRFSVGLNTNLFVGAAVWLVVGYYASAWIAGKTLVPLFTDNWPLAVATFTLSAAIALGGYRLSLFNVVGPNGEVGFRGVLRLGNTRVKKSGPGLNEGWNSVILPRPLVRVDAIDCRDKRIDVNDEDGSYSKDNALAAVESFLRYRVVDPYVYVGAEKVEDSLEGLAFQSMRIVVKQFPAIDLVVENKRDLSDKIAKELEAELKDQGNPGGVLQWGVKTGAYVVSDIWASDELNAAWEAKPREEAEGIAEGIQATRRAEQIKTLTGTGIGIDADAAYARLLVDVKKPGATSHHLSGLDVASKNIADAIAKAFAAFAGKGATP